MFLNAFAYTIYCHLFNDSLNQAFCTATVVIYSEAQSCKLQMALYNVRLEPSISHGDLTKYSEVHPCKLS